MNSEYVIIIILTDNNYLDICIYSALKLFRERKQNYYVQMCIIWVYNLTTCSVSEIRGFVVKRCIWLQLPFSDIKWGRKKLFKVFDIIGRRENNIAPVTITSKSNLSFVL